MRRKRLMSEINVVPYIDVMLVLLIIFMITAPLITQGVKIDLPKVSSEVLPPEETPPLIVSVDKDGRFYLNYADVQGQLVEREALVAEVRTRLSEQASLRVLVEGDTHVGYGRVVELMALLQSAGVESVGLISEPLDQQGPAAK